MIQNDAVKQIKERVSISQALARYGYEPNRAGFMLCPMHSEDTPSLKVYPDSNSYYCFGCGTGGDVINFVMHLFHLDFKAAISRLDADFNLGVTGGARPSSLELRRQNHERWLRSRELSAFRGDFTRKSIESRIIRGLEKPPEGTPWSDPIWGMYAALLGRLDYLDNCYFIHTHWR